MKNPVKVLPHLFGVSIQSMEIAVCNKYIYLVFTNLIRINIATVMTSMYLTGIVLSSLSGLMSHYFQAGRRP